MALTHGPGRSAAAGARMMRRRLRASSWAGAACWAERGARLAAGAGPNGEEGEESERPRGEKGHAGRK